MSKKGGHRRPGKYGVDLGERGIYDTRNKLNDLTGKEWVSFTNSVWITDYSAGARENIGIEHRKIHPAPKPPALLKEIITFFTKAGGTVLDPFAGVGGTLLGAALAGGGRRAVGVELEQRYIDAYRRVCEEEGLPLMPILHDDARNLLSHPETAEGIFDLVVADPPCSDRMAKEGGGEGLSLPDADQDRDLEHLALEDFAVALADILGKCATRLKPKGYMVVFCKDLQPQPGAPNLLHADMIRELGKIPGLVYRGMRIWHDQAMSLYPFGYPYSFVMNQIHQYILIFRKEG